MFHSLVILKSGKSPKAIGHRKCKTQLEVILIPSLGHFLNILENKQMFLPLQKNTNTFLKYMLKLLN